MPKKRNTAGIDREVKRLATRLGLFVLSEVVRVRGGSLTAWRVYGRSDGKVRGIYYPASGSLKLAGRDDAVRVADLPAVLRMVAGKGAEVPHPTPGERP